MSTQTTTLTSLVLLKNLIDTNKEYHDYFIPFIEQIFTNEDQKTFEDHEIQLIIESDFGLRIPKEVVLYILKRMERQRILKKDGRGFSRGSNFKESNIKKDEKDALRQIKDVISALITYANSIRPDELSEANAMEIIQKFLEKFQIDCIKSYTQGTALPDLRKMELWESDILVGLFLVDIHRNNRPLFEKFMVLVQGNMLANALVSTDTSTPPKTYKKTTFYFDTPNLLNALGYTDDNKQRLAREMIYSLTRLDGRIAVFEHTIEEACGVIETTAENTNNPKHAQKPLNILAREKSWGKSDLLMRANRIHSDIEKLNIKIKSTPQYSAYNEQFQVDEDALKHILVEARVNIKENQNSALQHDINSIRSIYCLRAKACPRRLEDANVILVTSNTALAHAAYRYAQQHHDENSLTSIINDSSLTNIVWLKSPDFDDKLINAQTISLAYSAMRLPHEELEEVISKAEKFASEGHISQSDFEILRISPKLEQEIVRLKASGVEISSEQSISHIIEKARKPYEAKLDATQLKLEKTKEELDRYRKENNKKRKQKNKRCRIVSYAIATLISGIAMVIVLLSIFYTFFRTPLAIAPALIVAGYSGLSYFTNVPKINFPSMRKFFLVHCNRYWRNKK